MAVPVRKLSVYLQPFPAIHEVCAAAEDRKKISVCIGGEWLSRLNSQLFSQPPVTLCQIMSWGSVIYYTHTIYITILVGLRPSKSSSPS